MDKEAVAEIKKLYKDAINIIKNYDKGSDEVRKAIASVNVLAEQKSEAKRS